MFLLMIQLLLISSLKYVLKITLGIFWGEGQESLVMSSHKLLCSGDRRTLVKVKYGEI